jgi:anthranilate-CoA ligase
VKFNGGKNLSEIIYSGIDSPEKEAISYKGVGISYNELRCNSCKIASLFVNLGIKKNDRILIFLNDSPALIFSFLASIQIGAIPIVLNPKSKLRFMSHYFSSSKASVAICERENHEEIAETIDASGSKVLIIEQDLFNTFENEDSLKNTAVSLSMADDLEVLESFICEPNRAIIWQYTSGTTGLPKAVMHTVEGILHSNEAYAKKVLGITKDSRIYSTARMFFGYGLGNSVYFNLLNGATVYIDDRWPDENNIWENIYAFKPTHFFSVPNLYVRILDNRGKFYPLMKNISCSVSAGSALPSNIFKEWKANFSTEILDGIGATEVGHIFLSNRIGDAVPGMTGKPIDGYKIKLVSEHGDDPGVGVPGELWVKGPSVSLGYACSPEKTKNKFIDGWYRTGDKFIKNNTDTYRYLGRTDDIFKSKGRWVHPQEIEDFLRSSINCIKDVAIVPSNDTESKPVICLVKTKDLSILDYIKEEISDYISSLFGSHCKPVEYRELNSFPLNENGKIMRNKLLDIDPILKVSLEKTITSYEGIS